MSEGEGCGPFALGIDRAGRHPSLRHGQCSTALCHASRPIPQGALNRALGCQCLLLWQSLRACCISQAVTTELRSHVVGIPCPDVGHMAQGAREVRTQRCLRGVGVVCGQGLHDRAVVAHHPRRFAR